MRLLLVLPLALICAAACSSSDAAAPPSAAALTYTQAYCERLDRCQTRQVRDSFGDVATCASRIAPDTDDEFRSRGAAITNDQASACASAMGAAGCDVLTSALPECAFTGTLDDGAACGSGYECKNGSCFRTTADGVLALCGTCSPRVGESASCTNANCAAGFLCASGRCRAPAAAGATCDDTQPCKPNLDCVRGTCRATLSENAACDLPTDLALDVVACDPAKLLSCVASGSDPTKGVCTAIRYAAVGQTCGLDAANKALASCTASSCSAPTAGTCTADLAEGAACRDTDVPCEVPLSCIDGRCGRSSIAACAH